MKPPFELWLLVVSCCCWVLVHCLFIACLLLVDWGASTVVCVITRLFASSYFTTRSDVCYLNRSSEKGLFHGVIVTTKCNSACLAISWEIQYTSYNMQQQPCCPPHSIAKYSKIKRYKKKLKKRNLSSLSLQWLFCTANFLHCLQQVATAG